MNLFRAAKTQPINFSREKSQKFKSTVPGKSLASKSKKEPFSQKQPYNQYQQQQHYDEDVDEDELLASVDLVTSQQMKRAPSSDIITRTDVIKKKTVKAETVINHHGANIVEDSDEENLLLQEGNQFEAALIKTSKSQLVNPVKKSTIQEVNFKEEVKFKHKG